MRAYDAVKAAADDAGIPLRRICQSMGRADSFISQGASRGSVPKADTLADMLAPCGYVLAAVPAGDVPASAIVIDGKEASA